MTEQQTIDSGEVATLLGIKTNHVRQLVFRKQLVPVGKQKRKNLFLSEQVLALKSHRDLESSTTP